MKYEIKYREILHQKITIEAKNESQARDKLDDLYSDLDLEGNPTHSFTEEEFEIDSIIEILP